MKRMGKRIRKKCGKIISFMLVAAMICTAIGIVPAHVRAEETNPWDNVSAADWMANLDDNLKITQINLPGTHDSGTKNVNMGMQMGAGMNPQMMNMGGMAMGGAMSPQATAQNINVQPAQFQSFSGNGGVIAGQENIGLIMDVPLNVTVELGRTNKSISEILDFAPGSIIELDRIAGEPIDVLVNGKLVAKGEVVVIEECFSVRITEIIK